MYIDARPDSGSGRESPTKILTELIKKYALQSQIIRTIGSPSVHRRNRNFYSLINKMRQMSLSDF